VSFFDLDKHEFEVHCENGHSNTVTIGDVRAKRTTVTCHSCGEKIVLQPDANFKREIARVERELDKLKKTLDNFGR